MIRNRTLNEIATEAIERNTGRRWCTTHLGEDAATDGSLVPRNRTSHWICYRCQAQSSKRTKEIQMQRSAG